ATGPGSRPQAASGDDRRAGQRRAGEGEWERRLTSPNPAADREDAADGGVTSPADGILRLPADHEQDRRSWREHFNPIETDLAQLLRSALGTPGMSAATPDAQSRQCFAKRSLRRPEEPEHQPAAGPKRTPEAVERTYHDIARNEWRPEHHTA